MSKKILKKFILTSSLACGLNILMLENTQAMEGDRYMNDHDWLQFHQNRTSDASLSDQTRWEDAQEASKFYSKAYPGSEIEADFFYQKGTSYIKKGPGEYPWTGEYYHPPLISNQNSSNITSYYQPQSYSSTTYQCSENSRTYDNRVNNVANDQRNTDKKFHRIRDIW